MEYTIEPANDEDLKKLQKAVEVHKAQMSKRTWRRPDKVVSTIVIGKLGTEIIPNDFKSWLNPRLWISKFLLAVHYFLYRNVAYLNNRAWVTIHILTVPMYKRLVDFATDKKRWNDIRKESQKMVNDRVLGNLSNLKAQIEQIPDEKRKKLLMDAINDAVKKNTDN